MPNQLYTIKILVLFHAYNTYLSKTQKHPITAFYACNRMSLFTYYNVLASSCSAIHVLYLRVWGVHHSQSILPLSPSV